MKASPRVFLRLMARPAILVMLGLLGVAAAWPLADLFSADASSPAVRSAASLQLALLVPLVAGLMVTLLRGELLVSHLAWSLPAVQRGLLAGVALILAGVVAAVAGVSLVYSTPALTLAGTGLAILAFAIPGAAAVLPLPLMTKYVMVMLVLFAAPMPRWAMRVVEPAPVPVAVLAALLGTWLLLAQFTPATIRSLARWRSTDDGDSDRWPWRLARGRDREWQGTLATPALGPWLRAALYETGVGSGWRYLRGRAIPAALVTVLAMLIDMPFLVIIGFMTGLHGIVLHGSARYPLSRRQRARLVWVGLAVDVAVLLLLVSVAWTLALLAGMGPATSLSGSADDGRFLPIALAAWSLLPILLFNAGRVDAGWELITPRFNWRVRMVSYAVFLVAIGGLVRLFRMLFDSGQGIGALALAGFLTLLGWALLWIALHRYYARVDFITPELTI